MNRALSLLTLLLGGLSASAQVAPDKSIATMKVADGLQIELFAAEPMVINPTSMDIDPKGRVWVSEAVNYRRTNFGRPILRPEGDRIVVLIDKDGDGKADEAVTFYQGKDLYGPLGVCVAPYADGKGQKVYVCQSPDILVFEDKDGDLKADGPPKKFLTGIGGFDHDHGVHGINIGPDGKLYFTIGDGGVTGLQSSDGKGRKWVSNETDCRKGTVWRVDQDGKNLELIAHNFRNNYEACVDSFGEIWLSDNDDDGNQQTRICHVLPGGNYGYGPRGPGQTHWHEEQPGIVHKTFRTGFGSPTGICFYEGSLLPKKYFGQLLHCDAGPRELRAFKRIPKGAGYELEKEVLVTSSDSWFRLSDVCVAPDGSVLMCDWYDPGVGGHGMGDWTRGRIYRVTPKGHVGYKVDPVSIDTRDQAVKALHSPNLATRHMVVGMIRSVATETFGKMMSAEPRLKPESLSYDGQARMYWLMADLAPWAAVRDDVRELATGEDARFRLLAQRILEVHRSKISDKQLEWDETLSEFISSRVLGRDEYREMMISMRQMKVSPMLREGFYLLAKKYDGQDIFFRAALNIACGTDPMRRDAILADFDKQFPEWNEKVADLVWELRPKSMLPKMKVYLADAKLDEKSRMRIVDILASSDDPASGKELLAILGSAAPVGIQERALSNIVTFLPTKYAGLKNDPAFVQTITALLAKPESATKALTLVGISGRADMLAAVQTLATNDKMPLPVRKEAVAAMGKILTPESLDALIAVGSPENPLSIDAVKAIGGHLPNGQKPAAYTAKALESLERAINSKKATAELKSAALSTLAGSRAGTGWLLASQEKKTLAPELVAEAGRLLRNSPFQGERNKAMLLFPAPGKLDPKKLASPADLAKRAPGNAENGKRLLAASLKGESQCMRCHMIEGMGGAIGPDLSMIGKKASRENLFESLIMPSKAIADQFTQWTVVTTGGTSITGLLVEESAAGATIRDANGKDTKIAAADIDEKKKSAVSLMPDNLVVTMTEDELIDMVEYMLTLKKASLTPESWRIVGPFANDAEDSALERVETAQKDLDPALTHKGKLGDVKWTTVKANETGYVDLAAFYGDKGRVSASVLTRTIISPKDQDATILIGNDDGAKLFLEGKEVFANRDHSAAIPAKYAVTVKLKAGANVLVMKIVNGDNPHGFYLSIRSDEELKLK